VRPLYTKGLSLFEHKKLKAILKEKQLVSRLERMADEELYRLRLEYHAALGRQGDRVALRQLEKLRDQLLERSLAKPEANVPADSLTEPEAPSEAPPEPTPVHANAPKGNAPEEKPQDIEQPKGKARKRRPKAPANQSPQPDTSDAATSTDGLPEGSASTSSRRPVDRKPTFPSSTAKRIPK
jgi:outer membrane biosynthesis protein TonB